VVCDAMTLGWRVGSSGVERSRQLWTLEDEGTNFV